MGVNDEKVSLGFAAALAATVFGSAVQAADVPAPVYKAKPVDAWNPWMIRVRALVVSPDAGGHVNGIPGSTFDINTTVVPELDITYFFTPNWAVEEILGVTRHQVTGAGSIAGLGSIAKATLLPPTLTLQYHWTDFGAFKPYVGAGVNYTFFFDQNPANTTTSVDVKDTFGWALQAGFDYMFDRHWGWNVDVKKIFLRPDFNATVGGAPVSGNIRIDPWLIASGITYKF